MKFNRVRVMVHVSLTSETPVTLFEHEVPILQAHRGVANVTLIEDDGNPDIGPTNEDHSLEQEWGRLMEKPKMASPQAS